MLKLCTVSYYSLHHSATCSKKEKRKKGSSLEAKFQLIPNSFFLEQYELAASDEVIPPISLSLVFADQINLFSFLWELLQL